MPGVARRPATRRALLRLAVVAGSGLALGVWLPSAARPAEPTPAKADPDAFIRIDPGGTITLIMPHTEVGQGIYTSSAMLIAEELEVGLDQVQVQPAPPDLKRYIDPNLYDQATGGSVSTRSDWVRLREAGAAARAMLIAAAAARWSVDPAGCHAERGAVHHLASGRIAEYGQLADDAAKLPVPDDIRLKGPAAFKLIGTSVRRLDTPAKVNGTAVYGIDVMVPDMRFGTLAITPVRGGRLVRMDEAAARRVPGVHAVLRAGDEAVAVIGDHMWAAKQGLDALNPVWDGGAHGKLTTASLIAAMDQASRQPHAVVAKHSGDAEAAIKGAANRLSATYQSPFLSHSAMEPLNCTLHIQPDRAEMWVGTQVPVRAQKAVADATGLRMDQVIVHNQLMGGAFGRRLDIDSIEVAAALLKQVDYPVKLVWSREQDLRHDYYRPYYYDHVNAGLDADAVECAAETPYDIPAEFVDYVRHEPDGMNTSWWRGVGPTHNLFVIESFIDELATAAKKDPVEFRRAMLRKNPRALAVLDLAAEKSGWGGALPKGVGRGIGLQFAFGSYMSCVIEVEVPASGEIVLHRAVVAVDCGMTVNPDTVRAQIEGGLMLGLGTAMYNEITIEGGAIEQSNFHDYRTLRMNEAPKIEIHQIRNGEFPGGIGETGTAAAAPALGNALFAATGKRVRRLPFLRGMGEA